ncbi:hypothetical protein [Pseudoalteromonas sp. 2CM32C]|uniref:hypothetical protein n=1 Tax=Pseudoalteromonas sp. 2CM32C TaxID=2929852 RepID=UPI0020BE702E|nr:hypothetical protein [Pseudoalteromonas sp. 2CM32C]MCK8121351.1 hypothetical protein [Pseudoalteromonas sp. 2CM32C]
MEDRAKVIKELEHRQDMQRSRSTSHKLIFIFGIVLLVIGQLFLSISEFFVEFVNSSQFKVGYERHEDLNRNIKIWGGFFVVLSTVFFAFLYMVGFNPRKMREQSKLYESNSSNPEINRDNIEIVALLKSIDSSLEKGKLESTLSESERKEIVSSISATVESHLNESLLSKIEQKYGKTIHSSVLSDLSISSLNKTVSRLSSYANDLKSKAAVNLSYGIGATVVAIGTLIYVLFNAAAPENASTIQETFYYTSRLFLVLLVQGISIFFLNLYKSTTNNILYLSNEITNHESKRDALAISLSSGNFESASSMLVSLSNTERNFTLKKGETSIYDKGSAPIQNTVSESLITDLLKQNSK